MKFAEIEVQEDAHAKATRIVAFGGAETGGLCLGVLYWVQDGRQGAYQRAQTLVRQLRGSREATRGKGQ